MNDLLQLAVEAHGGLERWSQLTNVKASLSVTGNLWQLKAQPDALKEIVIEAQLKRQQLTTQLIGTNRRAVFTQIGFQSNRNPELLRKPVPSPIPHFKASVWRLRGITCMWSISTATRYGTISPSRFSTPILVL